MTNELDVSQTATSTARTVRLGTQPGERSLRRNVSWTFIGNVVYAGCQWGILLVIARLGSPDRVGQFTLGLAISAPVVLLTNLQLRSVQATDATREYEFREYLALRILTLVVAVVVVLGVVLIAGYRGATALVIVAVTATKVIEALIDVFYGLQQQHERMDRVAFSLMLKGIGAVVVFTILMVSTGNLVVAVLGIAAAWAVLLLTFDVPQASKLLRDSIDAGHSILPRWRLGSVKAIVWQALPLGFVSALISLNTNIPRYILEHERSTYELGIFASMAYLMVAGGTLIAAVGQSVMPRLARYYAEGRAKDHYLLLARLLGVCVMTGIVGMIVTIVFGEHILRLFYGEEYAAHSDTLVLVMLASAVSILASGLSYGNLATRRYAIQLPMTIAAVATTLVATVVLVPDHGINGAPLGILAGMSVQAILAFGVVLHTAVFRFK